MKIKISNYNFINKDKKQLDFYSNLTDLLQYFYLDGKEDTLYVNSKYNFYKDEKDIPECNKDKFLNIIDYNEQIEKSINSYLDEKVIKMYAQKDYSRYYLYNNIDKSTIFKVKDNLEYKLLGRGVFDFKNNQLLVGEFRFNPFTQEVKNIDEVLGGIDEKDSSNRISNIIKSKLIMLEMENGKAPDFIYTIMKIENFLQGKQTVDLIFDGYEKFKIDANLKSIIELDNNKIYMPLYSASRSFSQNNPNKGMGELKIEDFKGISFRKSELKIYSDTLINLENQIATNMKDKLLFKCGQISKGLEAEYTNLRNYLYKQSYRNIPTNLESAEEIISNNNQKLAANLGEELEDESWCKDKNIQNLLYQKYLLNSLKVSELYSDEIRENAKALSVELKDNELCDLVEAYIAELEDRNEKLVGNKEDIEYFEDDELETMYG